jgi:hypothetical protein
VETWCAALYTVWRTDRLIFFHAREPSRPMKEPE